MSTFMFIVTVQIKDSGPSVSEVPTSKALPPPTTNPTDPSNLESSGSAGGGTPLLTALLASGKWSIQSIQQLGQQTNGSLTNLFLLVSNP
jgi:hypothetical protein